MRPHRLRVTAFGPFAGTVDLDLDDVSGAGPFLLRGATGAGKTSLLDAVGYALFGKVPGARGLKQLRSDHAAVGVRTSVELWATVGGRAVHVVRTPDQQRPRARGTGTTTDRATVAVRVARDLAALEADDCDARWSGVQEANDELGRLVGMTHEQFVQVVLLPQGDFARFLRAADQDRADVLRALFDTRRFRAVEEHLRRRRDEARDLLAEAASRADAAAERVCARAGADEVPPSGRAAWAEGLLAGATEAASAARRSADDADASEAAARSAHGAATDVARLLEDLVALAGTEAALLDRASDVDAAREELADADRAAGVVALHALSTAAEARSTRALDAARVALDGLEAPAEQDQPDALDRPWTSDPAGALDPADGVRALDASAVQALSERLADGVQAEVDGQARLVALGADVERVREQEARVEALRVAAAVAGAEHGAAEEALTTLPGQVAALAAELETARTGAEDVPAALADVARWDDLVAAAVGLVRLVGEAEAAERRDLTARAAARDDEDALDALRRARLAGMSAELAAGLEPGEPCPVCGACEHPTPAAPSDGGLGEADEETARARARSSAAAAARAGDALAQVVARRDAAHAALVAGAAPEVAVAGVGDLDVAARTALADALGGRAEQARRRLAGARSAQDRAAAAAAALERARTAHAAAGERLASAAASLDGGHEALRHAEAESAAAVARLRDGLGDPDGTHDPAALREALLAAATDRLARARRAHDAVLALHAGLGETGRARQAALAAATAAGWADVSEAVAASRPRAWCDRTRREVADHERALHTAEAGVAARRLALAEGDLRVGATSGHDLVLEAGRLAADAAERQQELALRLAAAVDAARDAGAVVARATDARDALRRDVPALLAAEQGTGRLRDEAEAARALADLCAGANDKGTALSTYVLAAHLEQVVEAANLRLVIMSEGRYALVHVEEGKDRRRRAGLGLAVLDAWTGTRRPAGTLSGGETFLASLALALGLADVVAAEAGGARVDALFVDEGFGTLDPDSLDRAMDVLDQLQEHGRMVGVVSHVGELRQRLPRQVVVEAGRSGSTVRVATG